MKRNDFDARLAHHLRSIGRETCSEADVHEYALMSIANAAALAFYMKTEPTVIHCPAAEKFDYSKVAFIVTEKYEQVACNVQCVLDELP
jgi:hypothetical protein